MPILKTTIDALAIAIATAGGAGFVPKAPGTAGSAAGVALYVLVETAHGGAYFLHVILFLLIAGTLAAHRVETLWGHDSQRIVIDEVIGQLIAFGLSAGRMELSVFSVLAGFALFRLFDIVKPPPLRRLEKLPGGAGVIADDVGAGLYALGVMTVIQHFSS
jgi:phosphatidylglycerophosphatase A